MIANLYCGKARISGVMSLVNSILYHTTMKEMGTARMTEAKYHTKYLAGAATQQQQLKLGGEEGGEVGHTHTTCTHWYEKLSR